MSVDVFTRPVAPYPLGKTWKSTADVLDQVSGPITDAIVIYGGWGGRQAGKPLPGGPQTGTAQLVQEIEKITRTPPVLHSVKLISLEGAMGDSSVVQGFNFIKTNFHPLGRLIIYGYSMGGVDALALSRKLDRELPHYHFPSGKLISRGMPGSVGKPGTPPSLGRVRVDLLITVDVAFGPLSTASVVVNRTVAPCVRKNLNFYETNPKPRVFSQGGPNTPENPQATDVVNVDLSRRRSHLRPGQEVDHGTIDNDTWYEVVWAIRGTLGSEARPPFPFPTGVFAT